MSKSAVLCYGYVFPADHEFPWSYLKTVDDWYWFDIAGGGTVSPWSSDSKNDQAREYISKNPIPFRLIQSKALSILSVTELYTKAYENHVLHFDQFFSLEINRDRLLETQQFCQRHDIQLPQEPQWTLLKAKMPNRW